MTTPLQTHPSQQKGIFIPTHVVQAYLGLLDCASDHHHERQRLRLAGQVMDTYATLNLQEKLDFFRVVQRKNIWHFDGLRLLHAPENHTLKLIHMRQDLLDCMKQDATLSPLDIDFKAFLQTLFHESTLRFERILWHTTPRATLEKLIQYEAIHAIKDWADLQSRLVCPDRLLYAFFHPLLGDEPLIFIEIALTQGLPPNANAILVQDRAVLAPSTCTMAVFYGLSKSHRGLVGIPFGRLLLHQTIKAVMAQFDTVKTFVTLSPIPGLVHWAMAQLNDPNSILSPPELVLLQALQNSTDASNMAQLVRDNVALMRNIIVRYIGTHAPSPEYSSAESPNREKTETNRVINSVAHFHLGNGAELYDVQILADGERMQQSYGCMVNYRYDVNTMTKNRNAYCHNGKIALSSLLSTEII